MALETMKKPLLYDPEKPAPSLRFCRNDIFVLAGILLLSLLTAVVVFREWVFPVSSLQNLYAVVSVNGTEVARFDLSGNGKQSYLVRSPEGNLMVEVDNGQASVVQSDCPDKVCLHTGAISKPGQSVVCLPLKTVLRIEAVDGVLSETQEVQDRNGESVDAISK
jgi:hypothetical protein